MQGNNEQKPEDEMLEQLQAKFQACKEDMNNISVFAGGLEHVNAQLQSDLKAIKDNKKALDEVVADFQQSKTGADDASGAMQEAQNSLQEKIDALDARYQELEKIVEAVNALKESASQAKASVETDIQKISDANEQFKDLYTETKSNVEDLEDEHKNLKKLLSTVQGDHDKIVGYKTDLLDDIKDGPTSIKTKIDTLHTQTGDKFREIVKYQQDVQRQFADLEIELASRIEGLLPGAGAAGLASAYFEAKGRYGLTPFTGNAKNPILKSILAAGYYSVMSLRHSVNHIFFIVPLLAIVWLFIDMMLNSNTGSVSVQMAASTATAKAAATHVAGMDTIAGIPVQVILLRFVLSLPLGILALFGYSSIQLNRRLYEEYNYKQRFMQTYHGFEKEIAGTNNTELKERLLSIMLNVVEYKPALSMSEHQKAPFNLQETMKELKESVKDCIETLPSRDKPKGSPD